jgi:hypothetical protein
LKGKILDYAASDHAGTRLGRAPARANRVRFEARATQTAAFTAIRRARRPAAKSREDLIAFYRAAGQTAREAARQLTRSRKAKG